MRVLPERRKDIISEKDGYEVAWRTLKRRIDRTADPLAYKWLVQDTDDVQTAIGALYIGENIREYRQHALTTNDRTVLTPSYVPLDSLLNPNIRTPHDVTRQTACLLTGNAALLDRIGPTTEDVKWLDNSVEQASYVGRLLKKGGSRHGNNYTSRAAVFAASHLALLSQEVADDFTDYDVGIATIVYDTLKNGATKAYRDNNQPPTEELQFVASVARLLRAVTPVYPTAFPKTASNLSEYLQTYESAFVGRGGQKELDTILKRQKFSDLIKSSQKTVINEYFECD